MDVKELFALGKKYPWPGPDHCPRCRSGRLWGHGFALRYFEPFDGHFFVKRYRCPDCASVHTMRPSAYLTGFRHEFRIILLCLLHKVTTGKWNRAVSHQLQRAWWRALYYVASHEHTVGVAGMHNLVKTLSLWSIFRDILLM